jgi:hypothetical protein
MGLAGAVSTGQLLAGRGLELLINPAATHSEDITKTAIASEIDKLRVITDLVRGKGSVVWFQAPSFAPSVKNPAGILADSCVDACLAAKRPD